MYMSRNKQTVLNVLKWLPYNIRKTPLYISFKLCIKITKCRYIIFLHLLLTVYQPKLSIITKN